MKWIKITTAAVLVAAVGLVVYFGWFKQMRAYDYSNIESSREADLPINSAREAARYAKQLRANEIEQAAEKFKDELQAGTVSWRMTTEKIANNNWIVSIVSDNTIVPSFSCNVHFTSSGDLLPQDRCGWNEVK